MSEIVLGIVSGAVAIYEQWKKADSKKQEELEAACASAVETMKKALDSLKTDHEQRNEVTEAMIKSHGG